MDWAFLEPRLACPVDGSAPLRFEDSALRCTRCERLFPVRDGIPHLLPPAGVESPEVAQAKNREAKARDEDASGYDATVSSYQSRVEVSALLRAAEVGPQETVLDLGAGTGRISAELARAGAEVLAFDLSPRSLRKNVEKLTAQGFRVHPVVADACHLPLASATVKRAVSGMLLEHVPTDAERQKCLSELRRVLQPGGTAALTVYNRSLRKRGQPREGFHGKSLYYYRFDREELLQMLKPFAQSDVTAILCLPWGLKSKTLDRWLSRIPALASLTGELLLARVRR